MLSSIAFMIDSRCIVSAVFLLAYVAGLIYKLVRV